MRKELSEKLGRLKKRIGDGLRFGATVAVGGLIFYSLATHNGFLDSNRTKETEILKATKVKTVKNVEEKWTDNTVYSPTLDGYNPKVIRKVTFEDDSNTTLSYRTLAWQPFMKWKNGEEFNPQPGEKYAVSSDNSIVRRLK